MHSSYLLLLLSILASCSAFGQGSNSRSPDLMVTNASPTTLKGIKIPEIPPDGVPLETWNTLSDTDKQQIIQIESLGPTMEWKNMTEKERANYYARAAEALKKNPSNPVSTEEYWKIRTGGKLSKQDEITFKKLTENLTRLRVLKDKFPKGGQEFEKEKSRLELEKESLLKQFDKNKQNPENDKHP